MHIYTYGLLFKKGVLSQGSGGEGRSDHTTYYCRMEHSAISKLSQLFLCVCSGFITILTQQTSHFDLPLDIVVTYEDTVHIVAN